MQINFSASSHLFTLLFVDCSFSMELISPKIVYLIKELENFCRQFCSSCLHWICDTKFYYKHSWNFLALSRFSFFLSCWISYCLLEVGKFTLLLVIKKISAYTLTLIFVMLTLLQSHLRKKIINLCFAMLSYESESLLMFEVLEINKLFVVKCSWKFKLFQNFKCFFDAKTFAS